MRCKFCHFAMSDDRCSMQFLKDKDLEEFFRHLKMYHPKEYKMYKEMLMEEDEKDWEMTQALSSEEPNIEITFG